MSVDRLWCHQCGNEYGYIGTEPHPAHCPACHSSCVPPAGSLTVFDRSCWQNANGLSKLWIHTVDERGRSFEFTIAARNAESKLVRISIDGVVLDYPTANSVCRIPPSIAEEIAAFGIDVPDSGTVCA